MRKHRCGARCEGEQHRFITYGWPGTTARAVWRGMKVLIEDEAYYGPARVTRVEYVGGGIADVTRWEVMWVAVEGPGMVASGERSGAVHPTAGGGSEAGHFGRTTRVGSVQEESDGPQLEGGG